MPVSQGGFDQRVDAARTLELHRRDVVQDNFDDGADRDRGC